MNIDDLMTEFGAYYLGNQASMNRVGAKLYRSELATEASCTVQEVTETEVRSTILDGTEVLQASQEEFTPKGEETLKPTKINLFPMMINKKFSVSQIEKSWNGFMAGLTSNRQEWPVVRFFIEQYLLKKRDEDMEQHAIYKGVRVEPTAGVPGAAGAAMNGFGKVIDDLMLPTAKVPITVISTGAWSIDPVTFVGQVEAFVANIPEEHRTKALIIRMSETLRDRFRLGMHRLYNNGGYKQADALDALFFYPHIKVLGLYSMAGRNRILASTKENTAVLYKRGKDAQNIKIWAIYPNQIGVASDWWKGVGFWNPAEAFVNDLV
jgi:hypothetical protein